MKDWRSNRFGRAADSYHEASPVQEWMAGRLVDLLPKDAQNETILELGCGTGHLTRALAKRFPQATIAATDLSQAMLLKARADWPDDLNRPMWSRLDARAPHDAPVRPELVASNAVVQWFPDLEAHFRAIRSISGLETDYLVSGFSRSHFPQLEQILTSEEFGYPPGPGHDPDLAIQAARNAGWKPLLLHEESRTEVYSSAAEFLRHLKASGANRPPPPDLPLTRSRLQRLVERLADEAACPEGIAITWKPWFLLLGTP